MSIGEIVGQGNDPQWRWYTVLAFESASVQELLGSETLPGSADNLSFGLAQSVLQYEGQFKACIAFCHSGISTSFFPFLTG